MLLKIGLILAGWLVGAFALGILIGKSIALRGSFLADFAPDDAAEPGLFQSGTLEPLSQAVTACANTDSTAELSHMEPVICENSEEAVTQAVGSQELTQRG